MGHRSLISFLTASWQLYLICQFFSISQYLYGKSHYWNDIIFGSFWKNNGFLIYIKFWNGCCLSLFVILQKISPLSPLNLNNSFHDTSLSTFMILRPYICELMSVRTLLSFFVKCALSYCPLLSCFWYKYCLWFLSVYLKSKSFI